MRTTLVGVVLLLAVLTMLALPLHAQTVFTIEEVTEGVYTAHVVPRPPMYVFANALIVVGDDGVLVVDTHQSPAAAHTLLTEIKKLTDKPVRWVVNTHWHGDHVYGNQVYADAFPGVRFIGHHSTREDVLNKGAERLRKDIAELPASIETRREWLRAGKGPSGQELTEADRAAVTRSAKLREEYLEELKTLRLTPPDITFSKTMRLYLGNHTVELHHFGRAHTRGDIVVYLPETKLLAAGDLLEDVFPYFGDAYPSGWAEALEKLMGFQTEIIFPAHGPLQRDRELLDLEAAMLTELASQVAAAVEEGKTLEETKAAIILDRFKEFFTKGNAAREPGFTRSVAAAVERAYREAKGELEQ